MNVNPHRSAHEAIHNVITKQRTPMQGESLWCYTVCLFDFRPASCADTNLS